MKTIKQTYVTDRDVSHWFNEQGVLDQASFLEYLLSGLKYTMDFAGKYSFEGLYETIRAYPSCYKTLREFAEEILKPMPDKPAA